MPLKYLSFFITSISIILFIGCNKNKVYLKINSSIDNALNKKTPLNEEEVKSWFLKDIIIDSIPGVSINRAYDSLLKNKKGKNIIIAVLDSEIDINHKDFQNFIWVNNKEIPNNNIDDDENGYIDDTNGWNFLGNVKGENNNFTSYAYTRIIKKLSKKYNNNNINRDSIEFQTYLRAKKKYNKQVEYAKEDLNYANMLLNSLKNVNQVLSNYLPQKSEYLLSSLDSLKNIYPNNEELQTSILIKSNFIKYGFSSKYINLYNIEAKERIDKLLNLEYDDQKIIGDNPEDLNDISYGNNIVNNNIDLFEHGTEVTGSIVSIKNTNVKIMPVCISPFGDERDKDIANGIRYAVNNGAKIINMSFGKEFSMNKTWVDEAIKYAEKNNVLIISSAGNSSFNLDIENEYYPNDNTNNGVEISDNFMLIGGISYNIDKSFLFSNSNYGSIDVDLFAPAQDIYTTIPYNSYKIDSGTSLASAITSGVAGLIFSYYPNLTAKQVKHILMDSGLKYTIDVSTPTEKDKNNTTPFNQLSKSGRVLNAYNALIMADSISRR